MQAGKLQQSPAQLASKSQVAAEGGAPGVNTPESLRAFEGGERERGALGVGAAPEVGVPVLQLVPQVVRGRQEVLRP